MSAVRHAAVGGQPAQRAERASRQDAEGAPRTVIRGESIESTPDNGHAIIDYLRFTFLPTHGITDALTQLARYFKLWFPLPVSITSAGKGMFGYADTSDVSVWADGKLIRIAIIAVGGESAGGTVMVDMSGKGCGFVDDWKAVYATLQDLDARITRVDTALDLLEGFRIEQFDDMYFAGEFNAGGRIPSRRYMEGGNSKDQHANGRTLYLGKKANGKELCIYEKGKQLGNSESEWLRIEIRFGCRDRVIPHTVLLDPTAYFAGGFVALETLVNSLALRIKTEQRDVAQMEYDEGMKHLLHHLMAAYGTTLYRLSLDMKFDYKALVDLVAVKGLPRRLEKPAVASSMIQAHALA